MVSVVIVAGGSGRRMGGEVPKQFMLLNNRPILINTIERFHNHFHDLDLVVVLPYNEIDHWRELCEKYNFNSNCKIVSGGETRYHSVKSGLAAISHKSEIVMVHDAVRPLITDQLLDRIYSATTTLSAVVPVVEMVDSVRRKSCDGTTLSVDRSELFRVQTPQSFKREILLSAYNNNYSPKFTDDASVVESMGVKVYFVEGDNDNIKITTPIDIIIAEAIFNRV